MCLEKRDTATHMYTYSRSTQTYNTVDYYYVMQDTWENMNMNMKYEKLNEDFMKNLFHRVNFWVATINYLIMWERKNWTKTFKIEKKIPLFLLHTWVEIHFKSGVFKHNLYETLK